MPANYPAMQTNSAPPNAGNSPPFETDPLEGRYSRQILFPGIGSDRQAYLARAHAAIIGCGATGATTAALLARAGVGTLTLIDRDFVEYSNLQRQILFDEADARDNVPKAEAARRHIARFNSSIVVDSRIADLTPGNIASLLLPGIDLFLDCTDNFETRYLLNDYAVQQGTPWIYAAAVGAYAATMTVVPSSEKVASPFGSLIPGPCPPTACLACIFPDPPVGPTETCDTAGILSTAVNLAASLQTTEALKLLTRQPHLLRRSLLAFDVWTGEQSSISNSRPDPNCPVCAKRQFAHLGGSARPHISLCGRNSVQIHEHHRPIDLEAMRFRLAQHPEISGLRANELLLRFSRGLLTLSLFADGRAIIQGTTDPVLARSLYARFIGS